MSSVTWDRECHGLFDFDLKKVIRSDANFIGCGFALRNDDNVMLELPGLATE